MGLLDDQTQMEYYQGNDYGNYQFTSLTDIINQFMVVYVGENKVIPKASRIDVAFHAQRALAELSFDTFKSVKAHEIVVPATLQMILPHDYVNYTKLSWSDSAGIKHPIYPTKHTQNPFTIIQDEDGLYSFAEDQSLVINGEFDSSLDNGWSYSTPGNSAAWDSTKSSDIYDASGTLIATQYYFNLIEDVIGINNEHLQFSQLWTTQGGTGSRSYGAWQQIDVTSANVINLTASGTSGARQLDSTTSDILCDYGVIRVGITTTDPNVGWTNSGTAGGNVTGYDSSTFSAGVPSPNYDASKLDLGYVEWDDGTSSQKELEDINVSAFDYVWVYVQSFSPWTSDGVTTVTAGGAGSTTPIAPTLSVNNTHQSNSIDNISVTIPGPPQSFQQNADTDSNSTTWNNYKSGTPSENQDDYQDDTYWPMDGSRFGLDPQHAQANGSFFIDQRLGKIHFSSNISGKTVILDYISDSLGTDGEMQVHKFAEEAMYRYILHGIAAGRIQTQQIVPRLKKEKFAAIRQAKLRLSDIKIEELTQILRGKSKQIKH